MKKIIFLTVFILFTIVGCNNLQWSEIAPNEMTWNEAKQYCENLDEGGHNDWRLPNIDELRTTIKNCSKTETGGECKVSEKNRCLSSRCSGYLKTCYCERKENNGGYYSKLGDDDTVWLWSSSTYFDNEGYAWVVLFSDGRVDSDGKSHTYSVRCVR